MVNQATLSNGRGQQRWNGRTGKSKRLGDLGRDAAALAELQLKLLEEDLHTVKRLRHGCRPSCWSPRWSSRWAACPFC